MATATTREFRVSLPPQMGKWVSAKVESGAYGSADDLIREALRALQQREQDKALDLEVVRAKIASGLAQARRGGLPGGGQGFGAMLGTLQTKKGRKPRKMAPRRNAFV